MRVLDSSEKHPNIYVKYDMNLLYNKKGIPCAHIYNKKYLPKIGKELGANLFIMCMLTLVGADERGPCTGDLIDIEIKAYSSVTKREAVIYSAKRVSADKLERYFQGQEEMILEKAFSVANEANK